MTINTTNQYHIINFQSNQLLFLSINKLIIDYNRKNSSLIFTTISNNKIINTTELLINHCYENKAIIKRNTKEQNRSGKILIN